MIKLALVVSIALLFVGCGGSNKSGTVKNEKKSKATTFCSDLNNEQYKGTQDGYAYELWNQNGTGTGCMTLGEGALFSGHWDGIDNYLARRGLVFDNTQLHQEIGSFTTTYNCIYEPTTDAGNSYLSVYGWTVEPLIEYYVVEDWRRWIPSMAPGTEHKGSFEVDGSVYDVYESTRINQPSILGTATFQQYFSIRRDVRNSGTIDITAHFNEWESMGMELGKMNEVAFVVEGYRSKGKFEFTELEVKVK